MTNPVETLKPVTTLRPPEILQIGPLEWIVMPEPKPGVMNTPATLREKLRDKSLEVEQELLSAYDPYDDARVNDALTNFYSNFSPLMLGISRRVLNDPHLSEESAMAALHRVHHAFERHRYTSQGSFYQYISLLTFRVALKTYGKHRDFHKFELTDQVTTLAEHPYETSYRTYDLAWDVESAIPHLSPNHADLIRLRMAGLENEDIAQQLGLETNIVKGRLHRARQALKLLLENGPPPQPTRPTKVTKENKTPAPLPEPTTLFVHVDAPTARELGTGTLLDSWASEFGVSIAELQQLGNGLHPRLDEIWQYMVLGYKGKEIAAATTKTTGTIRQQLVALKKIIRQRLSG